MTKKEALSILKPEYNTNEALKQAYRKACRTHHPDHGGDLEIMKLVNAAYETLKDISWTPYEKRAAARETPLTEVLAKMWNQVKTWPTIKGEVVGSWLWVSGQTWRYKKQLKEMGFKWSRNKSAWYWHPAGYRKKSRKQYDMGAIRQMWGSSDLETETSNAIAA